MQSIAGPNDEPAVPGRRERKKAATRQGITDTARELFVRNGYDQVSMREIADAADVSVATLFKHFPGKEALIFGGPEEDAARERSLIETVTDRPSGVSVTQALRARMLAEFDRRAASGAGSAGRRSGAAGRRQLQALVERTPALRAHAEQRWLRHEDALAAAVAADAGRPARDPACAALARMVLSAPSIARRSRDPRAAIDAVFDLLERGWAPQ
ncbi:TetR/AcrR family transcriptional regulator [Nakamurella aerolata]|uniref:TetR/AcrR family transcriptional regulator n=1 Tax=Nakamurella aerolata TaxID=1656892 RepID=A0A849AAS5_9ACTN|nr:TetR/AcrR family transcriptional regulator [Nakamurella aerolata]NNG36733.1 TetR/AcrR family transcriptional regulator [Nakamurella aerolata]